MDVRETFRLQAPHRHNKGRPQGGVTASQFDGLNAMPRAFRRNKHQFVQPEFLVRVRHESLA
jgi:hypothetical protein